MKLEFLGTCTAKLTYPLRRGHPCPWLAGNRPGTLHWSVASHLLRWVFWVGWGGRWNSWCGLQKVNILYRTVSINHCRWQLSHIKEATTSAGCQRYSSSVALAVSTIIDDNDPTLKRLPPVQAAKGTDLSLSYLITYHRWNYPKLKRLVQVVHNIAHSQGCLYIDDTPHN